MKHLILIVCCFFVFDAISEGMLPETETEITETELPSLVKECISSHYKSAKISEATKIVKRRER